MNMIHSEEPATKTQYITQAEQNGKTEILALLEFNLRPVCDAGSSMVSRPALLLEKHVMRAESEIILQQFAGKPNLKPNREMQLFDTDQYGT